MKSNRSLQNFLQKGVDGQLSAKERKELMHLLDSDADAAQQFEELLNQSKLISKSIPVPSTERLSRLIEIPDRNKNLFARFPAFASVALLVIGFGVGLFSTRFIPFSDEKASNITQMAHAAHSLYSTEIIHPVEVFASQRDHLQTWLSNRLGAEIAAPMMGDTGFKLIGGRLLPLGDQAMALFMYEDNNGERISLLASHNPDGEDQSFRYTSENEILSVFWQAGPWKYSVVGKLPRKPLGQLAKLINSQLLGMPGA